MISRLALLALILIPVSVFSGTTPIAKPTPPARPSNVSVVRVNSTIQAYDFFRPWTKKNPFSRRGLGVLIEGGKVLVTAELVGNHTYVELEKAATAEKSTAVVERVDYESNLAIVRPADPAFLDGMKPLPLDSGARVGDRASVLQLEANGEIAETPGTLTSITLAGYPMDNMGLLVFRLSAPLQQRDGSFTLPAVREGRLLGLLMRYDARSQTADIIPPAVILHFLADAGSGKDARFPRAGLAFAPTRDPQLRRYLGLTQPGGVYVSDVLPGGSAKKAGLTQGDVILAVNGHPIDQDGNYDDKEFGRIGFSHITNTASYPGDIATFKIFRKGDVIEVPVTLEAKDQKTALSESFVMDEAPKYVILGGLVFLELSRAFLQEWGGDWVKEAPQRLVYHDAFQQEFPADRGKVVFLSQVLPSPDSVGYERLENLIVRKLNGREIKSLADLAEAAKHPIDEFQKIEFEEDPGQIFLDAGSIEKNSQRLQSEYALPALQRL